MLAKAIIHESLQDLRNGQAKNDRKEDRKVVELIHLFSRSVRAMFSNAAVRQLQSHTLPLRITLPLGGVLLDQRLEARIIA